MIDKNNNSYDHPPGKPNYKSIIKIVVVIFIGLAIISILKNQIIDKINLAPKPKVEAVIYDCKWLLKDNYYNDDVFFKPFVKYKIKNIGSVDINRVEVKVDFIHIPDSSIGTSETEYLYHLRQGTSKGPLFAYSKIGYDDYSLYKKHRSEKKIEIYVEYERSNEWVKIHEQKVSSAYEID